MESCRALRIDADLASVRNEAENAHVLTILRLVLCLTLVELQWFLLCHFTDFNRHCYFIV